MARHSGLFQIIPQHGDDAKRFNRIEISDDLTCAFERVFGLELIGYRRAVDESVVKNLLTGMTIECADVIGGGKAEALVGLRHQIADVNLRGRRSDDGFGDAAHQQIRNKAGEERARADADDIGAGNGIERLGQGLDVGRNQKQFLDTNLAGRDVGLAPYPRAIFVGPLVRCSKWWQDGCDRG